MGGRSRSWRDRRETTFVLAGLGLLAFLMVLPLLWWTSLAFQDSVGLRAPTSLADTWLPDGLHLLVSGGWASASSQSIWLNSVHGEMVTRKIEWSWTGSRPP